MDVLVSVCMHKTLSLAFPYELMDLKLVCVTGVYLC